MLWVRICTHLLAPPVVGQPSPYRPVEPPPGQGPWTLRPASVTAHADAMDAREEKTSMVPDESLTVTQCWAHLRKGVVGRVAVVHEGRPDVFPVNYAVDHGSVVFRTGSGALFRSSDGHAVAFEVDGYDAGEAAAWSVVVRGKAREVHQIEEAVEALQLPLLPWHSGPKPRIVRIHPDGVTGRRFEVTGGHRPRPDRPAEGSSTGPVA
jgi:uncharacterized protein